jgi:hypothetical protein
MMGKISCIAAEKGSMRDQDDGCIPLSDGVIELTGYLYIGSLLFHLSLLARKNAAPRFPTAWSIRHRPQPEGPLRDAD